MIYWLLALFIVVPLAELFLLVKIGELAGLGTALVLVIGTGILGAWLTRLQGLRALQAIRTDIEQGRMPTGSLADGALIAVAGLLLLTPGLITDTCGFLLLIPPVRLWARRQVLRVLARRFGPPRPPVIDID